MDSAIFLTLRLVGDPAMAHDVGQDQLAVIRISGMHSNQCEKAIQKALLAHKGVHEVEVDFLSGQASILYKNGSVTVDQLMNSVNQAGYHAVSSTQRSDHSDPSSGVRVSE